MHTGDGGKRTVCYVTIVGAARMTSMLKSLLILGAAVSRTAAASSDAGAQASALPPLAPAGADSADDLNDQVPEFADEEKRGWDEELRGMWKGGGDVVHEEGTGARGDVVGPRQDE